jgi:hypothetical protein
MRLKTTKKYMKNLLRNLASLVRRRNPGADHSLQHLSAKLDAINTRIYELRTLVERLEERSKRPLRFPSSVSVASPEASRKAPLLSVAKNQSHHKS